MAGCDIDPAWFGWSEPHVVLPVPDKSLTMDFKIVDTPAEPRLEET
jgi:hypothetical protein